MRLGTMLFTAADILDMFPVESLNHLKHWNANHDLFFLLLFVQVQDDQHYDVLPSYIIQQPDTTGILGSKLIKLFQCKNVHCEYVLFTCVYFKLFVISL